MDNTVRKDAVVELSAKDLNANGGVFCPSPTAGMKIRYNQARFYLDVARTVDAMCAYCFTVYNL